MLRAVLKWCVLYLILLSPIVVVVLVWQCFDGRSCDYTKDFRAKGDFKGLESAVILFKVNANRLPTKEEGLQALIQKPDDLSGAHTWMKAVQLSELIDPWGNPYHYFRSDALPDGFGLYSMGPDGFSRSGGDDRDDIHSWEAE